MIHHFHAFLKEIHQDNHCWNQVNIDLVFHHRDDALVKEYRSIEQEYRKQGISVVELEDL